MNPLTRMQTYAKLGLMNILRVAAYKLSLRAGLHPVQRLVADPPEPPFFRQAERQSNPPPANTSWNKSMLRFGWHEEPLPEIPPDWFHNPFSNTPRSDVASNWWLIPDFTTGDIKGLWELSRFDWVLVWSTCVAHGDPDALRRLNMWLADWAKKNPPYKGPNWKCGQEASIRVMHLITAAWILGQHHTPEPGLIKLLSVHLQRIAPTMSYAIGQQNNHGTSEAAALFLGGTFLSRHDQRADRWAREGRHRLEALASALISNDGSFSQYSVNYHRVLLDTYSLAEAWRRHRELPPFSPQLMGRLAAAAHWLRTMVDAVNGDVPNVGANDGARLLPLTDTDYRDFRPSVQLAAALFGGCDVFGSGVWNQPLLWLGVSPGEPGPESASRSFDSGGYHVLRTENAIALMRYPRFKFRPSQSDALHVDLWHKGVNLLRDAGTFSYNGDSTEFFVGTAAHNTITFDGRDQMPRAGRFLFDDWLEAEDVEKVVTSYGAARAAAAYTDSHGARHHRAIVLSSGSLICIDKVSGNFKKACLRWRLAPYSWRIENDVVQSDHYKISLEIDNVLIAPKLTPAIESRYYQKKTETLEIYVEVDRPVIFTTKINF